jgi:ribonuclease J
MAFVGASMVENAKIARRLGYLDIPEERIVPIDQALGMKASKVVLMCTGTQGEPSSILGRLSAGTNRQFEINSGDTVVLSSHPIPGNEEMVHRTINRLLQRGADVIYDAIAPVHVSGHASQEEQRLLLQTVHPKYFIPIHGELRHLRQHARLAQDSGLEPSNIAVVENGTVIEFHKGSMSIGERIPGGYVFVDGRGVGDVGPEIMREREALARDGFVLVHVQIDPKTGRLRGEPAFTTRGFTVPREGEALLETARSRIRELVKSASGNDLQSRLERELGKLFFGETRRNPMVLVIISGS